MAKHRLLNCEFLNASSFKVNISNRAKLLYLTMFSNADDKGFVDTTRDIITTLTNNDCDFDNRISLELLNNTYESALNELLDKGYIYEFKDNHGNKVHLIRHWFYHNKYVKGLWTNYRSFFDKVHLESGEYILGRKPLKESNENQDNVNEIKLNNNKCENMSESDIDILLEKYGRNETTQKGEDELTEDDFPFQVDLSNLRGNK